MVIIFQLIGAEVAIRRMATHTVVKQFYVFKDTEIRFLFMMKLSQNMLVEMISLGT